MNPVFQFIAATLIVAMTLGFTLYAVTSASSVAFSSYTQLQLEPIANSLMQNFVLNPGFPSNWGSNPSLSYTQLSNFGLALSSQKGIAYSLDVNKLNRILNNSFVNNYEYIPPTTAGTLLGIYDSNHFNYGFDFRMVPALNITLNNITQGSGKPLYGISVLDYQGRPAINANVNVSEFSFCVLTTQSTSSYGYNVTTAYNVTNLQGNADVSLNVPPVSCQTAHGNSSAKVENVYVLMASADYFGMRFQNMYQSNSICKAQMIIEGSYLVANFTGKNGNLGPFCKIPITNNSSVQTSSTVFEVTSNLNVIINPLTSCPSNKPPCNLLNSGSKNYAVYNLTKPVDANVVLAGIIIKNEGSGATNDKQFFVIASNPMTPTGVIEYTSNSLTTVQANTGSSLGLASVSAAVTVSRFVNVGTNTWFATLTVWRMGQ